ncbi:hypothetical protein [Echinimonas agarilytica]|uniref:Uncharacterized protein n=1 Tax=Echinimonas agarilytica TaxID=1215918 RepID=A0AA41WDA3_9GAMM|nr:hypothetical protein [Echinimonas agarilytica]MCM2681524.1 hypothetical protein [Echinimonas agarilytica]
MISQSRKLTALSSALLSVLMLSACGSDNSKPSNNRQELPDPITFQQAGTEVELNYTLASTLLADEYNGEQLIVSFAPDQTVVTGLGEFKTHTFNFEAPATMIAPDPTKCPSEEGYLTETPYRNSIAYMDVNPTAPGSGHADGSRVTSVINGDAIAAKFALPQGMYDMTFESTLVYANESTDFKVTTPKASDFFPDGQLEFDYTPVLDFQQQSKPVADGQTIRIKSALPVFGLSNYLKHEFIFESDETTYIGENENEEPVVLPVARIEVFADSTFNDNVLQAYGACVQNADYLAVTFELPDYVFDQTYRAQLTWQYEDVTYDLIQATDDDGLPIWEENGEPVMVPKLDERGLAIVLKRETKTQYIPFEVVTEAENPDFDPIDPDYFANDPRNSDAEISTEEAKQYITYTVNLTGYNTQLPVTVDGAMYAIDGRFFSDLEGAMIAPGQTLQIRVELPDEYVTAVNPCFTVGSEQFCWTVKTKADPNTDILSASLEFPAPVSAIAANTVILRGHAQLNTDEKNIDASALLINGNAVDSYDAATGLWLYTADLSQVADGDDVEYVLTSNVDESITAFDQINLLPLSVWVTKLADDSVPFPANAGEFTDFVDVAIDGREGFPVFYLAEYEGMQVSQFNMVSSTEKLVAPTALFGQTNQNTITKKLGGITVNNHRPASDGNYLIRHSWQGTLLEVSDLSAPTPLALRATEDAYLHQLGNTIWDARQTAMSENGNTVYVTGNDGLATMTLNYNLEGTPVSLNDSTTHRKWLSRKTFGSTTNYEGSIGVDLLYIGEGDQRTEYILVIAKDKDTKNTRVYATNSKDIYDENAPLTQLNIVDAAGNPLVIPESDSIAADNKQLKAYVASQQTLYEVDLSNLAQVIAKTETGLAELTSTAKELPLVTNENQIGKLSAVVTEGGLPYLTATDMNEPALYAIDQYTGQVVYLMQGEKPKSE